MASSPASSPCDPAFGCTDTAAYPVISTRLLAGRTLVHVVGDAPPDDGFVPVEATLEDVYFAAIAGRHPDLPSLPAREAEAA